MQPAATAQAEALPEEPAPPSDGARDLRHLPWTSIDNPESRDLDQIEVLQPDDGAVRLIVGIADVAAAVGPGSPIDRYAGDNTTSVYTGVHTYTMLPSRMSYDLTSLVAKQTRRIVAIDMLIRGGELEQASIYPALAVNQAKLDYPSISAWLDGGQPPVTGADGRQAVVLALAAQKSFRENRPVRVAEVDVPSPTRESAAPRS